MGEVVVNAMVLTHRPGTPAVRGVAGMGIVQNMIGLYPVQAA
jgi:hypothetical protein